MAEVDTPAAPSHPLIETEFGRFPAMQVVTMGVIHSRSMILSKRVLAWGEVCS